MPADLLAHARKLAAEEAAAGKLPLPAGEVAANDAGEACHLAAPQAARRALLRVPPPFGRRQSSTKINKSSRGGRPPRHLRAQLQRDSRRAAAPDADGGRRRRRAAHAAHAAHAANAGRGEVRAPRARAPRPAPRSCASAAPSEPPTSAPAPARWRAGEGARGASLAGDRTTERVLHGRRGGGGPVDARTARLRPPRAPQNSSDGKTPPGAR